MSILHRANSIQPIGQYVFTNILKAYALRLMVIQSQNRREFYFLPIFVK